MRNKCRCGGTTITRDVPRGVGSLMAREVVCTRCGKILSRDNLLPMVVKKESNGAQAKRTRD